MDRDGNAWVVWAEHDAARPDRPSSVLATRFHASSRRFDRRPLLIERSAATIDAAPSIAVNTAGQVSVVWQRRAAASHGAGASVLMASRWKPLTHTFTPPRALTSYRRTASSDAVLAALPAGEAMVVWAEGPRLLGLRCKP